MTTARNRAWCAPDHGTSLRSDGPARPKCLRGAGLAALVAAATFPVALAARDDPDPAVLRASVHAVANAAAMQLWLERVPVTRQFPPDFNETLHSQAPLYVVEVSTAPGCVPCADLWARLSGLGVRYGWRVQTISADQAMLRSGRLGLPWIGHPVGWVRPIADRGRTIPIAIGTDHASNLARNMYLAAKMLTGVRPSIGVRALSKFTGIVAPPTHRGIAADHQGASALHARRSFRD